MKNKVNIELYYSEFTGLDYFRWLLLGGRYLSKSKIQYIAASGY
jgi:hypothetical protein